MALKLKEGVYPLGPGGLPETVSGLEELLQDVRLCLTLPKGSFPYGRALGSALKDLDLTEEHRERRVLALANEALMDMPGVKAVRAVFPEAGGIVFTVSMPLGEGEVTYGSL